MHVHPVRMFVCFSFLSVRLPLCDDDNACFFVKGGQLRWTFAYSGSLPLYLLIQNNILFGVLGK